MQVKSLSKGDIIIHQFGTQHALMFVGEGEKPLVHNTNSGNFKGAIAQSLNYFSKLDFVRDSKDRPWSIAVYRLKGDSALDIASRAAEYAKDWSVSGAELTNALNTSDWRSPYGGARFATATSASPHQNDPVRLKMLKAEPVAEWNVKSLFRAVKAVARHESQQGLSPKHGVSCSQFVAFCYQAAALEVKLGTGTLPEFTAKLVDNPKTLKLKVGDESILQEQQRLVEDTKGRLGSLALNAKFVTGELLNNHLKSSPDFDHVGYIACHSTKAPIVFALEQNEPAPIFKNKGQLSTLVQQALFPEGWE